MDKKIARWLLKMGAVTLRPSRPFTWASGIKSPIYCDNRLLLSSYKTRSDVIQAFEKLIRKNKIKFEAVAGIATGGIPYAAILADHLKKPMLYVRGQAKAHGKGNQVEGIFKKGASVLVIEDLVSTGMSSLAAVRALRKAGAKVTHCLAIFSYGFPKAQKAFKSARCQLMTLTGLNPLLAVSREMRQITSDEEKLIRIFRESII